jgi:hypothetical protein
MIGRVTALAIAGLAMTGVAAASELAPGAGHSIHLGRFDGSVYYTVEAEGYRVVATLASGTEEAPIRFVATLAAGQGMTISVPQAVGQPALDFEIVRTGDVLVVGDPVPAQTADATDE